jgi:hypothetical protein
MLIIAFVVLLLLPNHSLGAGLVQQRKGWFNETSTSSVAPGATVEPGALKISNTIEASAICSTTLPSSQGSQISNRTFTSPAWGQDINKTPKAASSTIAFVSTMFPSSLIASTMLPSSLIFDINSLSTASSFAYNSSGPPKATASVVSFTGSGMRSHLGPYDVFIVLLIGVVRIMA